MSLDKCNDWFNFQEFYSSIAKNPDFFRYVEVGVWKGKSVAFLADAVRDKVGTEIFAVDLWEDTYKWGNTDQDKNPEALLEVPTVKKDYEDHLEATNTRHLITDIKQVSWIAASLFDDESLDVVFIDADHTYETVKMDITNWGKKVRVGGLLCGHDCRPNSDVEKAVKEYAKFYNVPVEIYSNSVWVIRK